MRILILIIIVFSLLNCVGNKSSVELPVEYYFIENSRHYFRQLQYSKAITNRPDFELVFEKSINYQNKKINIKKYSNAETAAIDGEGEIFFVDTLMIYERSVNWTNAYRVLQSNNDSINKLVSFSLAFIMGNSELFQPEPAKRLFEDYQRLKEKEK